jgi:hypothetical protein
VELCNNMKNDNQPICEIYPNGHKRWYLNGNFHREDGPAIEWADGEKHWYLDSKFHRVDGSAIEFINGGKEWYLNGKRHREDGPAIECTGGYKYWYYQGINFTEKYNCNSQQHFERLLKLKILW